MSLEILDEVFTKAIGIHFLEPEVENVSRWGVKADIF
jgi:hypothetical protein